MKRVVGLAAALALAGCGGGSGDGSPMLEVETHSSWPSGELVVEDGRGERLTIAAPGAYPMNGLDGPSLRVEQNPPGLICATQAKAPNTSVTCVSGFGHPSQCVTDTDSDKDGVSDCQELYTDNTNPWDQFDHKGIKPGLTVYQFGDWQGSSLVIGDGLGGELAIGGNGHFDLGQLDLHSLHVKSNPKETFCELQIRDDYILVNCHDKTLGAKACVFQTDSDGDGITDCIEHFVDGTNAWDANDHANIQALLVIEQQGTWGYGSLGLRDGSGETRYYNQSGIVALNGIDAATAEIVATPYGLFCTLTTDDKDVIVTCADTLIGECRHQVDSDADGLTDCDEFHKGTNPWLADTDGDGKDDQTEVNLYSQSGGIRNNPLIANTPELGVQIATKPKATIHYSQGQSVSTGESTSQETAFRSSQTRATGSERSMEYANSETLGHAHSIETGIKFKGSIIPSSNVSVKITNSLNREINHTTTEGASFSFSSEQSTENSGSYQQAIDRSQQNNVDMTGADLQVGLRLKNLGFADYRVADLVLSAYWLDPANPHRLEPIGNLTFDNAADKGITMIGNSVSELLIFSIKDLPLEKALRIMRKSEQIMIRPASYALQVADGSNALLGDEDVAERTARVELNFGPGGFTNLNKRVAVNRGVTDHTSAHDILVNVFGMPFEQGVKSWTNGTGPDATTAPSGHGLIALNGLEMNNAVGGYWQVAHEQLTGNGYGQRQVTVYNLLERDYDLNDIDVHTGDVLVFSYVLDRDRDGLTDQMEADLGTNPNDADTDDDGIADGLEVTGWIYDTGADGSCPGHGDVPSYRVFSNPLLVDSDGDGVSDADEIRNCTAPSFKTLLDITVSADYLSEGDTVTLQTDASEFPPTAIYHWQLVAGPRNADGAFVQAVESVSGATAQIPLNGVGKQRWQLSVVSDGEERLAEVDFLVVRDTANAVFVDTAADPTVKTGSYQAPFPTLSEALLEATSGGRSDIYLVGNQSHDHSGTTINLNQAVNLFGGFDRDWYYTTNPTQIQVASPGMRLADVDPHASITLKGITLRQHSADRAIGLQIDGTGIGELHLLDSDILTANATGQAPLGAGADQGLSAYGLHILAPASITIANSRIVAGAGSPGRNGQNGADGADLGGYKAGQAGRSRTCNNPQHPDGWRHGPEDPRHDESAWGCGPDAVWNWGANAKAADNGVHGTNASRLDDRYGREYVAASGESGGLGEPGSGGSAAQGSTDSGGDGGGSGLGGSGGTGGGGSFAIWANNQQASGAIVIDIQSGTVLNAGAGGFGGDGGLGGRGGKGAEGWQTGGNGAGGGHGGYGAAGAGGTVAGIALAESTTVLVHGATIRTGAPGAGGLHGAGILGFADTGGAYSYYYIDASDGYSRVNESANVQHSINGQPTRQENIQ